MRNIWSLLRIRSNEIYRNSPRDVISFWAYLSVAILAILSGAFIKNNSLSIGFIGGGVLNLLIGIGHSSNMPVMNFSIFLFLFFTLILIVVARKNA